MKKIFLPLVLCLIALKGYGTNYYFSSSGNDANSGLSPAQPWLSFSKLQGVVLQPGDSILLKAGDVFVTTGNIKLYKWVYKGNDNIYGTADDVVYGNVPNSSASIPIVITTYPAAGSAATIRFLTDTTGIELYNVQGIHVMNLTMTGTGIGSKPSKNGISLFNDDAWGAPLTDTLKNYYFSKLNVGGFKNGFSLGSWGGRVTSGITLLECTARDNFINGMITFAQNSGDIRDLLFRYCYAYGNSGDQNALINTGSGIVIGDASQVLVEKCIAYNNGFYCNASEGPVGIWAYNSTGVVIQYCESHHNKTAGPADGGGFDLDGGCQQCIIQYCYSHDNDGAGFLVCQYAGARAFKNNVVRYNISQNDGGKNGYGSLHFYSSGSNGGITSTEIYHNTFYNSVAPVVKFQVTSGISGVRIRNNIFVAAGGKALIVGNPSTGTAKFENNLYWTSGGPFDIAGYTSLTNWRIGSGQEMKGTTPVGMYEDPKLTAPGMGTSINNPDYLDTLTAYRLTVASAAINTAQNLTFSENGNINPGPRDYFGNATPYKSAYDIGAHEYNGVWPFIQAQADTFYLDGYAGSNTPCIVTSNVSYKFVYAAPWLSVTPPAASGNHPCTLTATQLNLSGLPRTEKVIVTRNDASAAANDTFYVIQKSAYSITFSITDIDNKPIKNAAITINSQTQYTDINGRTVFTLIAGNYTYSISRAGYEPVEPTPFIVSNGNLIIQLKMTAIAYKVMFHVTEKGTSDPVGGARISIGSTTYETSGAGMATFLLEMGTYLFNISRTGYYSIPNTSFMVQNDTVIEVSITPLPGNVHNITFKVLEDTLPVADATVIIDTLAINTSEDGLSVFTLENGIYSYTVSKHGYDTVKGSDLTIEDNDTLIIIHLQKTKYPVLFVVQHNNLPVAGAEIIIDTLKVFTDNQGHALFTLPSGEYTYSIRKNGYQSLDSVILQVKDSALTLHVSLSDGATLPLTGVSLSAYPVPSAGGLITLAGESIQPGTLIEIYNSSGTTVYVALCSDAEQIRLNLSHLPAGIYFVRIINETGIRIVRIILE